MARPKGPYTVPDNPARYGELAGRRFDSFSQFETYRAHSQGFTSIRERYSTVTLEAYKGLREQHPGISRNPESERRFNRAFVANRKAERGEAERGVELTPFEKLKRRAELSAAISPNQVPPDRYLRRQLGRMFEIEEDELEDLTDEQLEEVMEEEADLANLSDEELTELIESEAGGAEYYETEAEEDIPF